ncbi:MAG: class I SAM-dependent RNA methyltransferase, partial [Cyanobacteriota bacterium]|nr:class I SAM-dependent RNA methyltransferase [Cyanobacteriota bacterium]
MLPHPKAAERFELIAVVPPGLEEVAAAELADLGAEAVRPLRRAVSCRTDRAGFYRLHLQARLPFRFLRELARFPCSDRESLRRGVLAAADWQCWLPPERSLRVDVSGGTTSLNHSHYTALEVKNALVDQQRRLWGARSVVDLDDPDLSLHLHLRPAGPRGGGEAVLSLDGGGGASLHRRGYRAAMGLAPLKENLAAGLIAHTGWDGRVPLCDPLCGSGTLLIEAVTAALDRAPGLNRRFSLMRWPDFDPALWRREEELARSRERDRLVDGTPLAPVIGLERDPEVLAQAEANVTAAGLETSISLQQGDARDFVPPPQPGLLVCNPPYGARLGEGEELEQLYADLGRMLKGRCGGWTLWLLSGNPELTGALRMKASRRI